MPITANGTGGRERRRAQLRGTPRRAPVSSRSVASSRAKPRRSRVAMRSSSRRLNRRSPSRRCSVVAAPLERVERVVDELGARASRRASVVVVAERVDELGLAAQRLADAPGSTRGGGTCARPRPATSRNVDGERRRPGRALGQPPQLEQAEVGVGGLRQPLRGSRAAAAASAASVRVSPRGELAHRRAGALDVGEAERGEALLGRLGRQRARRRRASRAAARRRAARGSSARRAWCVAVLGLERARARSRSGLSR